jgi:hypothetical protein
VVQGCGARNLWGKWFELQLNPRVESDALVRRHTRTFTLLVGRHVS